MLVTLRTEQVQGQTGRPGSLLSFGGRAAASFYFIHSALVPQGLSLAWLCAGGRGCCQRSLQLGRANNQQVKENVDYVSSRVQLSQEVQGGVKHLTLSSVFSIPHFLSCPRFLLSYLCTRRHCSPSPVVGTGRWSGSMRFR